MNTIAANSSCQSVWSLNKSGAVITLLLVGFLLSGCTTLTPNPTPVAPEVDSNAPGYKLIFASSMGGEPKIFDGRITEPMTVQDALVESGAIKKYRGMRIDLARKVVESGQVLKLPVVYDPDANHVINAQNYALHPGDEILIRRDNGGSLNSVFKSLGPTPSALH